MNNTVNATGMTVKAESSGSLVITTAAMPTKTTSATNVSLTSDAHSLKPCTHDSTWGTYTEGLKYVSNADVVDAQTGVAQSGSTLTFAAVTETNASSYYVDYKVFIAVAGNALTNQDLTVKYTNSIASETDLHKAASIDFYVQTVTSVGTTLTESDTTYKGKLALANVNTTTPDTVTLVSNGTIPSIAADTIQAIEVTMRVYFDGALERDTTNHYTYVYSNSIDATDLALNVQFDAATHTA